MRIIIVTTLLLFSITGSLCAATLTDLGGGFAYQSVANGQCQVLYDSKYGQPILESRKWAPSTVVMVGDISVCPGEYGGHKKGIRFKTGQVNGFIYTGVTDKGQRIHIYRKMGATFIFKYGPNPKR